jgi:hypothetical protein
MELAPVIKQDMLIEGQLTLPTQQTQLTVSHNEGSKTRYCCMAKTRFFAGDVIVINNNSIMKPTFL